MSKIHSSDKVYISKSKIIKEERGVFAKIEINKGKIIEMCPVIEIPAYNSVNINKSVLVTYIYYLGKNKKRLILALGYGSIYNHSYQPNAIYKEKYKNKIINFIAKNKIKKNEEITINYNQGIKKNKNPLWFKILQ